MTTINKFVWDASMETAESFKFFFKSLIQLYFLKK